MDELKTVFNLDISYIILGFFALVELYKYSVNLYDFVTSKLGLESKKKRHEKENYETLMSVTESIKSLQEERIEDLKKMDERNVEIKNDLADVLNLLKRHIKIDDERTVATFRSTLYRMHSDFMAQGFITQEGLKTFVECGKAYEAAGGDDIYHDKLKPEVMSLVILKNGVVDDAKDI